MIIAFFEILGCIAMFNWVRNREDWLYGVISIASLTIFAWLFTVFPDLPARTYAAYGGIYILSAFLWLTLIDGQTPTAKDVIGVLLAVAGAIVISSQFQINK